MFTKTLTAIVVLFCASAVSQAQTLPMTPIPDAGPGVFSLSCIIIAKEIEDLKGKIEFEEFRVIDAKQQRNQRFRELEGYRADVTYGEINGLGRTYMDACRALVVTGEKNLAKAEENLVKVEESVEFWLRIYKTLLFLAEVKYAGFNCPPIP